MAMRKNTSTLPLFQTPQFPNRREAISKPPKPERHWVLLEPTGAVPGDELGWVAMRRFIKALGRQYHITLIDIRPEHSEAVPKPPEAQG